MVEMTSVHHLPLLSLSAPKIQDTGKMSTSQPPENTFTNITTLLRLSCEKRNSSLTSSIHANILKLGLGSSTVLSNILLNSYSKCGQLEAAGKVFDEIPERSVVSWTSMMTCYSQKGLTDEAISLFWEMLKVMQPNEYTISAILQACAQKGDFEMVKLLHCLTVKLGFIVDEFLDNSLINAYAKCGMLEEAERLLAIFKNRDVVTWTSVISGYVYSNIVDRAVTLFFEMQEDGVEPNEVTIVSILQACSAINDWRIFRWIHGLILKKDWCGNPHVVNSLVEMYLTNGYFQESLELFCRYCFLNDGFSFRNETVASLLHSCGEKGYLKMGEAIHGYLVKNQVFPCTIIENSLINMYAENRRQDTASKLFTMMRHKDTVSWNTILTCLVKNGQSSEALDILTDIHINGAVNNIFPDFVTMLNSMNACCNISSLQMGQVIHGYLTRTGMVSDIFLQNSLIELYARSGKLDFAEKIFDEMKEKDLGSWNTMISAYGINGNGICALHTFTELKRLHQHKPNTITFLNVLSACAHNGLVKEGIKFFEMMSRDHGIDPSMEHYACMVDLFGRSNRLTEAHTFIKKMPISPGKDVWSSLLGACALFGNVEIGERAATELSRLDPNNDTWRISLSNLYASIGKWEDSAKIRQKTSESKEAKKEIGWSGVEARGEFFKFGAGDVKHVESQMIYKVVRCLHEHIRHGGSSEVEAF